MHTSIVASCAGQVALRKLGLAVLAFAVTFGLPSNGRAITLTPSVASPQMLGTPVTWTAAVQNPTAGHTYDYQFSVTFNGQTQIVQDFSPTPTFTWVPHTVEGAYTFNVVVRDITTAPFGLFAPVSTNFNLLPWVTAPLAAGAVNPTTHPLIALFSGPPCAAGHQLLVRFHPASPTGSQNPNAMTTNLVRCSPQSANFYVAGMYPSSPYLMHWEEYNGTTLVNTGADLPFTTRALPATFHAPTYQVNVPATADDAAYPVVIFQLLTAPFWPTATDLAGNVIWYGVGGISITRMEPGGIFYADGNGTLVQYDLASNPVLQTNVEILNEQLVAKGYPTMTGLNGHEVRSLPNGDIALLASRDVASTSAQGGTPANPVDILGDMVLVLDHNLQLQWAWDSFAHEDINRMATDGDICTHGGGGCAAFSSAFTQANDWLHTNALQGTADGNIILSQRAQDMVLKINYANGTGDGSVIWRMGAGLDFTIVNPPTSQTCNAPTIPGDPNVFPWFTHQHDASFQYYQDASGSGDMLMTIFDDGNTRVADCPGTQHSRGMVLLVDEPARQVYIETAADLGGYSSAVGSGQLLTPPSGNVYASYDNGLFPAGQSQATEVNLAGQIVYQLQVNVASYRTYRMQNLDTPVEFEIGTGTGVSDMKSPDQPFDFTSGFTQDVDALQVNGSASLSGNTLELTSGGTNQAGSIFYTSPVDITSFTTDFGFQLKNPAADGFTFAIQNVGATALGSNGGSLGYAPLGASVAVKFDLYQNTGDVSNNSTGLYVDGVLTASTDLTGTAINLHSGDNMAAHLTYDGTTLNLTITDLVTLATFSHSFAVNIPADVGGNTAYIGFTGGTGGQTAIQQVLNWSYQPGQAPYDPTGIPTVTGLTLNGSASLSGTALKLTNGGLNQAASAFYNSPVNITSFDTDFQFQLTNPAADGFTFTIQNTGSSALGSNGGSLGYAGIGKSVAIKFDLYQNTGDVSNDSTGVFVGGAQPTGPSSIDLTGSGINLHSGDIMDANIAYDGETLTLTLTDTVTNATWSHPWVVNIPSTIGSNSAYVGFTASTGGLSATQQILNWIFE